MGKTIHSLSVPYELLQFEEGVRTGAITEADVKAWRLDLNRLALMTAGKFLDYPPPEAP